MIGQLRGIILEKQPPQLLLEVGGVGYEIDMPTSAFERLPIIGQSVLLHTHFIVREDAHLLYGFDILQERSLFRILLKVNGVGPRLALTILSHMTIDEFVRSVVDNNPARLTAVPGVGKKTAERLVIEMRDKVSDWGYQSVMTAPTRHLTQDAIAALITLGYKPTEASHAISKIESLYANSEDMIRHVLKERMV